ncbi:MAG TPA: RusA family crossover junction endodeoxyribonuclease [archaeon]|nr:RusA family crossover junction endodeoxyribonuclease [archaeon]
MRLEFFVPGDAKTSGSKRGFVNKKSGKVIFAPANPKQKDWQAAVKWFATQAANHMVPLTEPAILTCCFYRKRPDGHYRTVGGQRSDIIKPLLGLAMPGAKPDSLKLCRAVEDAMSGIIYHDDALICDHHISKRYCDPGQVPGVQIIIETYQIEKDVKNGKDERQKQTAAITTAGSNLFE